MKTVIAFIIFGLITGSLGYNIGRNVKDRKFRENEKKVQDLINEVKQKNNQMLKNTAEVYKTVNHTEGKFTEFDEYLMSFWME